MPGARTIGGNELFDVRTGTGDLDCQVIPSGPGFEFQNNLKLFMTLLFAAREKIIAIEPFRDKDGIGRCRLVMQPKVIAVSPRPMRPFQGWRYLTADSAPSDLTKSSAASVASMPEPMRRELRDLGLL